MMLKIKIQKFLMMISWQQSYKQKMMLQQLVRSIATWLSMTILQTHAHAGKWASQKRQIQTIMCQEIIQIWLRVKLAPKFTINNLSGPYRSRKPYTKESLSYKTFYIELVIKSQCHIQILEQQSNATLKQVSLIGTLI